MNTPNPKSRANLAILLGILVTFVLPAVSRAQTADTSGTTTATTTTSVPATGEVISISSQQLSITKSPFEVQGTSKGYSDMEHWAALLDFGTMGHGKAGSMPL